MPASKRAAHLFNAGAAALLVGLLGVLLSALLPEAALRTGEWSDEDAKRHQQVSLELHDLSLNAGPDREQQQRLKEARREFLDSDAKLRNASDAPRRWRALLRWGGGLLCVVGAGLLTVQRSS